MTSWLMLLTVPAALALMLGLLLLSAYVEERVLSPQALVVRVARTRAATPEHAEAFVARQLDQLLRRPSR